MFNSLLDELHRPAPPASEIRNIPIRSIAPNPYNPRRNFDQQEIAALAASIQEDGLLQPIVVRPSPIGLGFELISGQRRLLVFQQLEKSTIPAIIRDVDDQTAAALAIVENVQRQDVSIIEVAEGYYRLKTMFGLKQDEIAQLIGKSRSAVANALRVLRLPFSIRRLIRKGKLKEGHARVLLSVKHPETRQRLAWLAAQNSWTVRKLARAARLANHKRQKARAARAKTKMVYVADERLAELAKQWGTPIHLFRAGERGEIHIIFNSHEDFEWLFNTITHQSVDEVI